MLLNEPASGFAGSPPTQIACTPDQAITLTCPAGANAYFGTVSSNTVSFNNLPVTGGFLGIPDAGVIRITNIRVRVPPLPPGSPVSASLSVSGNVSLLLSTATPNVAFVDSPLQPTEYLSPDLSGPIPPNGIALSQCVPINKPLALDPASASAPEGPSFVVRVKEKFLTAFKILSTVTIPPPDVNTRPPAEPQNIPGTVYPNSETMFFNPLFPGSFATAGLASQATRILVRFNGPPFGVQVHAPIYERGKGPLDSRVRLVAGGADGASATYTPLGPLSTLNTFYSAAQQYFSPPGFWQVYVYEFTAKAPPNPNQLDTVDLPFYLAHTGMPYVSTGTTTVSVTLAPTSEDATPAGSIVPRFADLSVPVPVANLTACSGSPAVKVVIGSKAGPANARVWQIGVNNYGTAAATNAAITGVTLSQTFGAACTPVVSSAFPVAVGTVNASSTVNAPVAINFTGCAATARFKVDIGYAADGGISGTSTYFNQFQ